MNHLLALLTGLFLPHASSMGGCHSLSPAGMLPIVLETQWNEEATELCSEGYAVLASGLSHGPLWSAEHLTAAAVSELPNLPRMGEFVPDLRLPLARRAELTDWYHSGYDRGHMTPSGDMPDPAEQQETFLLSNVVPQTAALNRHAWEHIEAHVRALAARYGSVYVVTGPAFEQAAVATIGPDRVWIPDEIWKAVFVPGHGAAAWICTNDSAPACRVTSVSLVAALVGIDPFPGLAADVKAVIAPLTSRVRKGT